MSLAIVLFENYDGKFQSFPSPTDTIEDYDNIVWTDKDIPSKEELEIKIKEYVAEKPMKLLREERDIRLQETDWWALRGNMSSAQTNYRQSLRDIPTDYETSKYDELLARDSDGNLTHSVWTKPS